MRNWVGVFALTTLVIFLAAFAHKEPEYQVEFPAGWEIGPKDASGLVTGKPAGGSDGGVNCNAYVVDRESITGSQKTLNDLYGVPISVEAWNSFLSTEPEDTKISERVAVEIDGKFLQIATVELISKDAEARIGFIVTPGRIFDAGCYARRGSFERHKAVFEKIVRSLRPF